MNLDSRSREYLLEHFSERWGLTETLGTSLLRLLDHMKEGTRAVDISDGLVLLAEKDKEDSFLVANPVLQEWIKIPSPPPVEARCLCEAALVTHMSNDGDLLGYKVVRWCSLHGIGLERADLWWIRRRTSVRRKDSPARLDFSLIPLALLAQSPPLFSSFLDTTNAENSYVSELDL
ncbi:unnamed protein product [Microthlaspi erraticum]|uniref:F-box protein At3g26010-like beta-propeller domain-containing protein n=1 Tax=Microthlaspi erraticum TaxID=1685480 RepID=A0A6D2JPT9_9BRAS|nr:unnamed protein product [Microthlaspi erraticum]